MSDAWLKQQEEVWGEGPEFRQLVDSIHNRNDRGAFEGDKLADRLVSSGAPIGQVVNELLDWVLAEMPTAGAFSRARSRFNTNFAVVCREMDGPGYPNGSPMSERTGRMLLWTVVNALLRGPQELPGSRDGSGFAESEQGPIRVTPTQAEHFGSSLK